MRIIAGDFKGKTIYAPKGDKTRPTSDKLRGALFNILVNKVYDSKVLDLFGGSGAMALEALSRGADFAAIVDMDRNAIDAIKKNATMAIGDNYAERLRVIKADYRKALDALKGEKYDIVFIDPPYAMEEAYEIALDKLIDNDMLADNAVIVMEKSKTSSRIDREGCDMYLSRIYGETRIDLICMTDSNN